LPRSSRLVLEAGQIEDHIVHFSADRVVVARPSSRYGGSYMLNVDHRAQQWTLQVASERVSDLRWVPRLIRLYFGAFLQSQGCAYVHAASVEWQGHGILFAGAGGSGKTSLSFLACARLGARFLSDDTTVVRPMDDGSIKVFGWPRRIALGLSLLQQQVEYEDISQRRLRREGLDFSFPADGSVSPEWARANRVAFDPAEFLEIFNLTATTSVQPALVVFPSASAGHTRWARHDVSAAARDVLSPCGLRQMEYVTDFLGVTPFSRPRSNARALSVLQGLPAIAVSYGPAITDEFGSFWEEVICRHLPRGL
jgi:hypothetical protein